MSLSHVDLLILGAGWTSSFLLPLLKDKHRDVSYAYTTRDGRDGSIRWSWDSESQSAPFDQLPSASTIVITFPLKGAGQSKAFVDGYLSAHEDVENVKWVQLGSTGIFDGGPTLQAQKDKKAPLKWTDRHSPYITDNPRAIAEDELIGIAPNSFILDLSGLWGGSRDPFNWLPRIAPTKDALRNKGSVHLIHGLDVARAIVAVHLAPPSYTASGDKQKQQRGERYALTDLRVYDWWDLAQAYATSDYLSTKSADVRAQYEQIGNWVIELMHEHDVRALPRTPAELGRAIDSRDFWVDFKLSPVKGRAEKGKL